MTTMEAKRELWAERVESWRRSGETAPAYAERHGWKARTLMWWASQGLRAKRAAARGPEVKLVEVVSHGNPVEVAAGVIEVILRNGRRLQVKGRVDVGTISALARALET